MAGKLYKTKTPWQANALYYNPELLYPPTNGLTQITGAEGYQVFYDELLTIKPNLYQIGLDETINQEPSIPVDDSDRDSDDEWAGLLSNGREEVKEISREERISRGSTTDNGDPEGTDGRGLERTDAVD